MSLGLGLSVSGVTEDLMRLTSAESVSLLVELRSSQCGRVSWFGWLGILAILCLESQFQKSTCLKRGKGGGFLDMVFHSPGGDALLVVTDGSNGPQLTSLQLTCQPLAGLKSYCKADSSRRSCESDLVKGSPLSACSDCFSATAFTNTLRKASREVTIARAS